MGRKKNLADLKPEELKGKVVFVRADLNVPQVGRCWQWCVGAGGWCHLLPCCMQLSRRCAFDIPIGI